MNGGTVSASWPLTITEGTGSANTAGPMLPPQGGQEGGGGRPGVPFCAAEREHQAVIRPVRHDRGERLPGRVEVPDPVRPQQGQERRRGQRLITRGRDGA